MPSGLLSYDSKKLQVRLPSVFRPASLATGLVSFFSCTGGHDNHDPGPFSPNIVIILADDLGYGDTGCYNSESGIPTPNIDRIAQKGIRLTDAYAHPWCVPSRYGLITGKHPLNSKLNWREQSLIEPGQLTIASLLGRNGYYTAMIGKWHLGFDSVNREKENPDEPMKGGPVDHGFDYFFGIHASLDIPPYFYIENDRAVEPPVNYTGESRSPDSTRPTSGKFWRSGNIAPGFTHKEVDSAFVEKSVEFIRDYHQKAKEEPFFLYLSLASPHTPWLPGAMFEGQSGAGSYGDFVMQVDNTVGRIIDILEQTGYDNETLLIFTSDNGPLWYIDDVNKFGHRAAGDLRGMKNDVWEGGHRIPFLAQWPGFIPENIIRDDLFSLDDMLATMAGITGDKLPESYGLNSCNQLPVLLNRELTRPVREKLLIYDHAIRYRDWKFIEGSGEGRVSKRWINDSSLIGMDIAGELYNLVEDISEKNNLYFDEPERVGLLKSELNKMKEQVTGCFP